MKIINETSLRPNETPTERYLWQTEEELGEHNKSKAVREVCGGA